MNFQPLFPIAFGIGLAILTWRASRSGEAWTPSSFQIGFVTRAKQPELFTSVLVMRLIVAMALIGIGILGVVWPIHPPSIST